MDTKSKTVFPDFRTAR